MRGIVKADDSKLRSKASTKAARVTIFSIGLLIAVEKVVRPGKRRKDREPH